MRSPCCQRRREERDYREIPPRSSARIRSRHYCARSYLCKCRRCRPSEVFFSELLRCLDCPAITGCRISESENDVLRQPSKTQPRLLAIDEIHHPLTCTPREQRAALNISKFLSNQLRASKVALGISEALHVMRTDQQIASRFESHTLPFRTANRMAISETHICARSSPNIAAPIPRLSNAVKAPQVVPNSGNPTREDYP